MRSDEEWGSRLRHPAYRAMMQRYEQELQAGDEILDEVQECLEAEFRDLDLELWLGDFTGWCAEWSELQEGEHHVYQGHGIFSERTTEDYEPRSRQGKDVQGLLDTLGGLLSVEDDVEGACVTVTLGGDVAAELLRRSGGR